MNYRKRKKLRRIAKSHNCDHYYKWKECVKFQCKFNAMYNKMRSTSSISEAQSFWNCFWIAQQQPRMLVWTKAAFDEELSKYSEEERSEILRLREEFQQTSANIAGIPVEFLKSYDSITGEYF